MDGKHSKAIENFTILSRLDSTNYEAYFFRGIAKYNLGDFNGALLDFDRTLHFNTLYTPAYHYRGITLSRIGNYELALRDIQSAIDLRPNFVGFYFSRGVTYFFSQQFDLAIKDFNKYIRRVPDESDAYIDRGACYLFMGDTIRALKDYEKAISINRNDPEGYVRRSRVMGMQGKFTEALSDLNKAISLDTANTFAYFNRAILLYETGRIEEALSDLNKVLKDEPGNALTLYNRALILSNVGDYEGAVEDYDRVLNINPGNVLAYYNRAAVFTRMGRYRDAVADYSKAIELYPDFAQAYMNRSYVRNMLGQVKGSKSDYDTAQKKIAEYKAMTSDSTGRAAFADTARKYDALLALDADFAKNDFDNELIQYRDVDVKLRPLYKFSASDSVAGRNLLTSNYDDSSIESFSRSLPLAVVFDARNNAPVRDPARLNEKLKRKTGGSRTPENLFSLALAQCAAKQYNSAMEYYNAAISSNPENPYFHLNRGALQAEMITFLSSIDNSVQVLSLDDSQTRHSRIQDRGMIQYDYTPALNDMLTACELDAESPYVHYNLGNLYCLSNNLPEAIAQYSRAVDIAPMVPEPYFNRGLVQIFLKDREKGCIDLSIAGELGIDDAYAVIKKYCKKEGVE